MVDLANLKSVSTHFENTHLGMSVREFLDQLMWEDPPNLCVPLSQGLGSCMAYEEAS